MPFANNPGCSCCGADATGCCINTDLKALPSLTYNSSTNSYDFSGTQWYYTDADGNRKTHFTGDVPVDGTASPNTLPAGSTVQAEFNICCLDYIFEVEILSWDQNDNNSYVKAGATQWRSWDWDNSSNERSFIQSRTSYNVLTNSNFYSNSYRDGYTNVELGSFLGNGSTEERVVALNYNPQRSIPFFATEQTAFSDGRGDPSWATNLSRPIKLVIVAGDSDLEIGAVRLRQGSNTRSSNSSESCINYSGLGGRRFSSGVQSYAWPKVVKGASIYKSGYGSTDISDEGIGRTACSIFNTNYNNRTQPKHTFSNSMDFSGRNGNFSYELLRLNNDQNSFTGSVSATLADESNIAALATAVRTDDWESLSLIPTWWRLWWTAPKACPAAVPDNTHCQPNTGSNHTVDSSCNSPTTSPSFTSSNSWPWNFSLGSTNASQPCPYFHFDDFADQTTDGFYEYQDETSLYQWQAGSWGGYGNPNFAGASLQSTINTYLQTNDPNVMSGCDVDGFAASKYWRATFLGFGVVLDSLNAAGVDRYESPNAVGSKAVPPRRIPTVSHSSNAFAGTVYSNDQGTVVVSGYMERQLSFSVYKSWVENIQGTNETLLQDTDVQGDWTGETLLYENYEKAIPADTKQGRTQNFKIHQNCVHNFTVSETEYTGSPPTAGTTTTATQNASSVIPNLTVQTGTRPSGVYDDGKIYQYSDDGLTVEYAYWSSFGYLLHEVSTDDGDTWHLLFNWNGGIAECRRLSDNTKFSSPSITGSSTGCDGENFTLTDGSPSVVGTVTEISFTVKGTR